MSNFVFLQAEWPDLHDAATKAEAAVHSDPRSACFYSRRVLEMAVKWMYVSDATLKRPFESHLSALIHEPTFKALIGARLLAKAKILKDLGNQAVHSHKVIRDTDALTAVRELFHFCFWLARTYSKTTPPDTLAFDAQQLAKTSSLPTLTPTQLQALEDQLAAKDAQINELLTGKSVVDAELERLRAELAEIKKQNEATPDQHNYSEAETRDYFIDLLLREAGWPLDKTEDREYRVEGMPNTQGEGFVDYVLWGDDGKPLGLVEAKRTKRSPKQGQQQAKLYADCLEKRFGQRPIIFYSNGYEHWIWDDLRYPPRPVQGFYKKDELELMIQRRNSRLSLATAEISPEIVERYYQTRAIRRIGEAFEKDHERKALVVMATGAGKTRTVIALCDVLMRCNWAKRVLFLADRVALVNQAVGAFKRHLPASSPVNLVTEKDTDGRVFVSTYPTMLRLIDEAKDGQRRFGIGHFDLVIIDEAHRSVYQRYRAIFEYFDSLLVGLTATPKDEVDRNTYGLFDLDSGVPTDNYGLEEAVKDGFLVPPRPISVPLKFQREGILYDNLPEEEKEEWDAIEWDDDGNVPNRVEAEAVNKWLFNRDTVDKVLEHLMLRGMKVAGGDRLGKTIVFAKNHDHAEFIAEVFNVNYPHYRGEFARVIDFKVEYAQSLIDSFSHPEKQPHIALSVDMLDTGIDIPEVVNLVFFKMVRSKTKFWQMVGRGTRLRPDLFAPGKHKQFFYIFDYCQNLEFFGQNPDTIAGAAAESLGKKLFRNRVELISELDKVSRSNPKEDYGNEKELRGEVTERLRTEVAAMNLDNFIVRPKRRLIEKYREMESWQEVGLEQQNELVQEVAGLPSELADEDVEAKQFDLLILRMQLSLLRAEHAFTRLSEQVKSIGAALEEKASIPMVSAQMDLILEIQTDAYWQDITTPILEDARKKLRALVKFIDKSHREPIYTDFEDVLGDESSVTLPGFGAGQDFERFRGKVRLFLKEHENSPVIHKLRFNEPLTTSDLEELESILLAAGIGTAEDIERAKAENNGLGLFVRSLAGLDRQAAKAALDKFLAGKSLNANQIEFVSMVIDNLTQRGWIDPALLYESPFTDFNPLGVEGVFPNESVVSELIAVLDEVRYHAVA